MDSHAYHGYFVPPNYDSLVAKVIAYGDSREQAIARMRIALSTGGGDAPGLNAVILCTDGGFNVGPTDPEELGRIIDRARIIERRILTAKADDQRTLLRSEATTLWQRIALINCTISVAGVVFAEHSLHGAEAARVARQTEAAFATMRSHGQDDTSFALVEDGLAALWSIVDVLSGRHA
mgnify:CR=1 FL=1